MTINFSLNRNPLSTEANQFRAIVHPSGTMDYEQIIDRVVRQNSTVTRADALAVMDDFFNVIEDALLLGFNVNTPGLNGRITIKGGFNGDTDGFTPGRNTVEISFSPGLRLRRAAGRAVVQKQESSTTQPRPTFYLNLASGELNSALTPGSLGQVTGYRLKFDPADPQQGIFFVAADGSASHQVSVIAHNGPSKLIFMTPASLTPGEYNLQIRSVVGSGAVITGTLADLLTVS